MKEKLASSHGEPAPHAEPQFRSTLFPARVPGLDGRRDGKGWYIGGWLASTAARFTTAHGGNGCQLSPSGLDWYSSRAEKAGVGRK